MHWVGQSIARLIQRCTIIWSSWNLESHEVPIDLRPISGRRFSPVSPLRVSTNVVNFLHYYTYLPYVLSRSMGNTSHVLRSGGDYGTWTMWKSDFTFSFLAPDQRHSRCCPSRGRRCSSPPSLLSRPSFPELRIAGCEHGSQYVLRRHHSGGGAWCSEAQPHGRPGLEWWSWPEDTG